MEGLGLIVAIIVLLLSVPVIGPALSFLGGWITGHVVLWILGPNAPAVLAVFSPKLTIELLPMVFGMLACIGSFFRTVSTSRPQKD